MSDTVALAAEVAAKLDYTTEDLELFLTEEGNEKFAACINNKDFYKALDRIEFQCNECHYWKPVRENATPDAHIWQCQECFNE